MSKIQNQKSYIENGQFSGGVSVSPVSGSEFNSYGGANPQWGFVAGGLYVGEVGTLDVKTIDNSIISFTSASGFIPGLISAVSASSTASDIIALR